MKRILGPLGLSLVGIALTCPAQASIYQLGDATNHLKFGSNAVSGSFVDKIYFDVGAAAYGAFSIQDVPVSVSIPGVGVLQALNIDNLNLALVDPLGGQIPLGSGVRAAFGVGIVTSSSSPGLCRLAFVTRQQKTRHRRVCPCSRQRQRP